MRQKVPQENNKNTIQKLRSELRSQNKLIKLLRKELEDIKALKPHQVTRSKQREIDKELNMCYNCKKGQRIITQLPFGVLTTCSLCAFKNIEKQ